MSKVPWALIVVCLAFVAGAGLAVGAVFVLAGIGWALLAAAVPCFLLSAIILRGLTRA